MLGLTCGLMLGQGSVFVSQTWLMSHGKTQIVGEVGVATAFVTFFIYLIDWGGMFILSRRSAGSKPLNLAPSHLIRALIALVCVAGIAIYVLTKVGQSVMSYYLLTGSAGLLLWSFNITGVLDGNGLSGVSGLLFAIPWIAVSVAMICCDWGKPLISAIVTGASFSAGAVVCVLLQYAVARWRKLPIFFARPTRDEAILYLREGAGYFFSWAPGQIYWRALLFLVQTSLGSIAAGQFVYVRSLLNTIFQAVYFVRRIEFPELVKTDLARTLRVGTTLKVQHVSIILSGLATLFLIVAYHVPHPRLPHDLERSIGILSIFSPLVLLGGVSAAFGQVLLARGKSGLYAQIVIWSTPVALIPSYMFLKSFGFPAIFAGEAVMYCVQIALYCKMINQHADALSPVERVAETALSASESPTL